MKILLINLLYGNGSTGNIVKSIQNMALNHGDVSITAYGYYQSDDKNTYKIKNPGGLWTVRYELLRIKLTGYHGYTSKLATKKLIAFVKNYNPDIINMHNIHSGYINIPLWFDFLRQYNKPIVWTLHDCWSFTGRCAHYSMIKCEKWKTGCYSCSNNYAYPGKCLFDHSRKQWLDKSRFFTNIPNLSIVTPSQWLASQVKQSFLGGYETHVIYNGVDTEVFKYRNSIIREKFNIGEKKIILGVALWSANKGLQDMLELSNLLDDEHILVLVGLKDENIRDRYPNVIPVPPIKDKIKLAEFYSCADVFVNPSREETLGMTTVEALSCGTPVVVYNETAVPEPVAADCGCIVNENTPRGIIEGIKAVEQSDICYRRTCREHVLQQFEANFCYEQYIELFHEKFDAFNKERE